MLVECPECDFEGTDPTDPFWPCSRCHGTGLVEMDDDDYYLVDFPEIDPADEEQP